MLWVLGFWLLSLLGVSVLLSRLFIEASKNNTATTESSPTASTVLNKN